MPTHQSELPDIAIDVRNLSKTYQGEKRGGGPVTALDSVSLAIPRGGVFGLLGPNGAGKSTLINVLGGVVRKTSGTVSIWGRDIDTDGRNARAAIGVVPQEINVAPFFSPEALLHVQAGLFGVPKAERRTEQILKAVRLWDKRRTYTRSLSGGMKRRLLIAKAMVHSPPILVLDEPTAGVDVELRQHLWNLVDSLREGGVTVILTTHYLEEAQQLCDRIAIIHHGKLLVEDSKDAMLRKLDSKTLNMTVERPLPKEIKEIAGYPLERTQDSSNREVLTIHYQPSKTRVGDIIDAVRTHKPGMVDISTSETDLQTLFLRLTAD